jgi:hypothetical protein
MVFFGDVFLGFFILDRKEGTEDMGSSEALERYDHAV